MPLLAVAISVAVLVNISRVAIAGGELELRVFDDKTGEPIAIRMHLQNQKGHIRRPKNTVRFGNHFVFFHKIVLELPVGSYTFTLERGPEYHVHSGHFIIEPGATDNHEIHMKRFVDMKQEGWWSGDLHVARRSRDVELLMTAEDLHFASIFEMKSNRGSSSPQQNQPSETVRFDKNRFYHRRSIREYRDSGGLLFLQLDKPLPLFGGKSEYPPAVKILKMAQRQDSSHIAIAFPESWNTPMWLASQMIDSINLATSRTGPAGPLGPSHWGKPRDKTLFPEPHGMAQWSESIYYQLLNCGLRIPPSAASGSGIVSNPVGYNRVYAYIDGKLSYDNWWDSLNAGKVVVTNGPLLRPTVHGHPPGHVFLANAGETLQLNIELKLAIRDPGDYLEIIRNGQVEHVVRLDEYVAAEGKLPALEFDESGWFLVRMVTNHSNTYRFACSGPFYVEVGGQPRISTKAAQFFLDWVHERARRIKHPNPKEQREIIRYHRAARDYWQRIVNRATSP